MKMRAAGKGPEKIEQQMAPMIDIVFQLLIFFMLTLKIVAPEGDFNVNMPLGSPPTASNESVDLPPMKVRLEANAAGELVNLQLGGNRLGVTGGGFNPALAFQQLNQAVQDQLYSNGQRKAFTEEQEVEIDADHELHYQYTIRAMSAVRGKKLPNGQLVHFIDKVKFAPPRQPKAGA